MVYHAPIMMCTAEQDSVTAPFSPVRHYHLTRSGTVGYSYIMATNIRVLHVDDEPEFLSLTAEYLDRVNEHITIETATSAEGVLERLPDQEFDCIVSDYDMPGMDGIKLLKAVRDEHPDLPFILFTGKGSEEVASDAISAGVSDYLQKGGTERFELLANRIQNLVEQAESVRSLRRFRQIADAAGHAIYFTDSDGVIEYVNPAFEDITGYSAEEAIGSHPRILRSGEHGEEYHKEKWETILAGQVWEEEITNLRKSGDRYHAYQTIAPVRGEDGDMEAFVAIQSDITERKEHDRERIRYKDIFDQAQEIANLGAWEADLRRNEAWTSDQVNRIYGLPTDQEIGIGEGTEYFHPEDRPIIEQAFERAAQDCEPYDLELRINGADDTDRWVRAIGEPQVNGGDVTRIRGTFQDITERKARERQLRETNQRLELALEEADAGIWDWNV